MSHEQAQSHEQITHEEIIGFNDGGTAIRWNQPGDVLVTGYDAKNKYLSHIGNHDLAIIKTKSGNTYGMGRGIVINAGTRQPFEAPDEFPDITIGAPLEIPGVGNTSDIESVTVEYKYGDVSGVKEQFDKPSPFIALRQSLDQAREVLDHTRTN